MTAVCTTSDTRPTPKYFLRSRFRLDSIRCSSTICPPAHPAYQILPFLRGALVERALQNDDSYPVCCVGAPVRGRVTVNMVPRPARLATSICPPCASAIHLQMARPRPAPGRSPVRVRAESARQKRSKMCGRSPSAIPIPVSATVSVTRPSFSPSCTWTLPPRGVYLTAFVSRLSTSCRNEEHTSELQSPCNLVCRLLLEKKKKR